MEPAQRVGAGSPGLWAGLAAWLRRNRYQLAAFFAVLVSGFLFSFYLQGQISGFIYWFDDWVFYADSSATYSHMRRIAFEGNMWRHPLYSLVVPPLFAAVKNLAGLGNRQAAQAVISLLAALNTALFFLLLHSWLQSRANVILFTILYGVSFSNLVFFSLPETYSLANLAILSFFLLAARFQDPLSAARAGVLGLLAGAGALVNPPVGLLLISVYAVSLKRDDLGGSLQRCLAASLVALLVYGGINFLLFGPEYLEMSRKLANRWATPANFLEPLNWLRVAVSFLLYSVISPLTELKRSIRLGDFGGYFRSAVSLPLLLAYLLGITAAGLGLARKETDPLVLMACTWLVMLFLFHVYFNPREALLYSSQVLAPLWLVLTRAFEGLERPWLRLPLAFFCAGAAYVNIRCLQG